MENDMKTTMLVLAVALALGCDDGAMMGPDADADVGPGEDAAPAEVAVVEPATPLDALTPIVDADDIEPPLDGGQNCALHECILRCEPGAPLPTWPTGPWDDRCQCLGYRCLIWHDGPACSVNSLGCVVLPQG
jgi:hypothetical protein